MLVECKPQTRRACCSQCSGAFINSDVLVCSKLTGYNKPQCNAARIQPVSTIPHWLTLLVTYSLSQAVLALADTSDFQACLRMCSISALSLVVHEARCLQVTSCTRTGLGACVITAVCPCTSRARPRFLLQYTVSVLSWLSLPFCEWCIVWLCS